jgi:hypothetical protein
MISTAITNQLYKLTDTRDIEKSIQSLVPEYINLKIFFLKQEISLFEMKWNMTYQDFENKSKNDADGFTFETEQEYYDWGEKVALLQYFQNLRKEWI